MENKITSGIWFVFIGLVLLLHNLNVIDFNFWAILKYWPLLIIIVGINFMVQTRTYGPYIKIGSNLILLAWVFYVGISSKSDSWQDSIFVQRSETFVDDGDTSDYANTVKVPFDSTYKEAKFEFNGGAGTFDFQSNPSEEVFTATSPDKFMGFNLKTDRSEDKQKIRLETKRIGRKSKNKMQTVNLNLNPNTIWDIELNYGAATLSGDLSNLNFKNLDINTGASTLDLKLGAPKTATTKISVETGASTIHLKIPKEAAIMVTYSSVMSSNSFEGFETNSKGLAMTKDYNTAANKYEINVDGAANTFTISRY